MYDEKTVLEVRRREFRDATPAEDEDMGGPFPVALSWKECPVIAVLTFWHSDQALGSAIRKGFNLESMVVTKPLGVADYHQVAHALETMGVTPLDPAAMEDRLGKEKFPPHLWDVSDYW